MKKINYIVGLFIIMFVTLSSCGREELNYEKGGEGNTDIKGQLNLSSMVVSLLPEEVVVKSTRAVNTDNYIVRIYNTATNQKVKEWAYKDMPEIITLSTGNYRIEVHSHDPQPVDWEKPYYYTDASFEIHENTITDIGELICTLNSIKVTIDYDEQLLKYMGDDVVVNVKIGAGSVDFVKGESRAAYFYTTDAAPVLVSEFIGSVDGERVVLRKSFTDVAVGQHRMVIYTLKGTDIDGNLENGTINPSIDLDASCPVVDKNNNVTVDPEPTIPDTDPDPEEPENPDKPTIKGNGIGTPLTLPTEEAIAVTVTAPAGIKEMAVDIVSPTLTPEELMAVGLLDHLDLVTPGDLERPLIGLGFPVKDDVLNQTTVSFDISKFGPMLSGLGAGTHKFVITVTDNSGVTIVENLILITQEQ